MHLIISKFLLRKKMKKEEKNNEIKRCQSKEEIMYESVFIHLNMNR